MASQPDIRLREPQRLARRHSDLRLDEIKTGHQLRDRVLDLQTRVHLEKVEVALAINQELDGASVRVICRLRHAHRHFAHAASHFIVDDWGRRFLNDLLMASLHRTFALSEINRVAALIAKDLDFNMAGTLDKAFEVNLTVAERPLRLAARAVVS